MSAASRGSGVIQSCVGQLLPGIIEFIARAAESDLQVGDPKLVSLAEALKSIVGVLGGVTGDQSESLSPFDLFC